MKIDDWNRILRNIFSIIYLLFYIQIGPICLEIEIKYTSNTFITYKINR